MGISIKFYILFMPIWKSWNSYKNVMHASIILIIDTSTMYDWTGKFLAWSDMLLLSKCTHNIDIYKDIIKLLLHIHKQLDIFTTMHSFNIKKYYWTWICRSFFRAWVFHAWSTEFRRIETPTCAIHRAREEP